MPDLLVKQGISVFEPSFGEAAKRNVRYSSLAGWKARSQLPIGYNWIFFATFYG